VHRTLSISGHSGTNGNCGISGTSGVSGSNGTGGHNGGRGRDGTNGSDGQPGQSGTDSQHAFIRLDGTVENLNMQLKTFKTLYGSAEHSSGINWELAHCHNDAKYDFQLTQSKGIILVQAVGGNGGDGG
jgi:hypothetical protein